MKATHAGGHRHVEDTLAMTIARFGPALVGAVMLLGLLLMGGASGRDVAVTGAVFILVAWLVLVVRTSSPRGPRGSD